MADFQNEVINNDADPLFVRNDEIRICKGEISTEAIRRYKAKKG